MIIFHWLHLKVLLILLFAIDSCIGNGFMSNSCPNCQPAAPIQSYSAAVPYAPQPAAIAPSQGQTSTFPAYPPPPIIIVDGNTQDSTMSILTGEQVIC